MSFAAIITRLQPVLNAIPPLLQKGRIFFDNTVRTSPIVQAVALAAQKIFGYNSYLPLNKVPLYFSAVWLPISCIFTFNVLKEVKWPLQYDIETLFDISTAFGQIGIFCHDGLHFLQNLQAHNLLIPQLNFLALAIPGLIAFNTISFAGRLSANVIEIYYAKTPDMRMAGKLSLTATLLDMIGIAILSIGVVTLPGYGFLTISVIVSLSRSTYNPPLKPDFS